MGEADKAIKWLEEQAWLDVRRTCITSTDIPAILGLYPPGWKRTALSVYLDKKGLLDVKMTPKMRWGLKLEEAIATAYEEETGRTVVTTTERFTRHPLYEWLGASIDRITRESDRVVELKNIGYPDPQVWGPSGSDEVPDYYTVQTHVQMMVAGVEVADIPALFGGSDLRVYTIPRNDELCELIVSVGWEFYQQVLAGIPPQPDWSHPATLELVKKLHRPLPGVTTYLNDDAMAWLNVYERFQSELKSGEASKNEAQARVIDLMGTAETAWFPDGRRVTRKTRTRKAHWVDESTYCDFRVSQPKGSHEYRPD